MPIYAAAAVCLLPSMQQSFVADVVISDAVSDDVVSAAANLLCHWRYFGNWLGCVSSSS